MARLQKNLTLVKTKKTESTVKGLLLDVNQVGDVKTLVDDSKKYQMIFNLDPEPEKPLRIYLDLDQLEDFKE